MFQGVYSQKEIQDKIIQFRNKDKMEGTKKKKGSKKIYHPECSTTMLFRDQYWLECFIPWLGWDKYEYAYQVDMAEKQYGALPLVQSRVDEYRLSNLCDACEATEKFWYQDLGTISKMRTSEGFLFKLCPTCEARIIDDPMEKYCFKCDTK